MRAHRRVGQVDRLQRHGQVLVDVVADRQVGLSVGLDIARIRLAIVGTVCLLSSLERTPCPTGGDVRGGGTTSWRPRLLILLAGYGIRGTLWSMVADIIYSRLRRFKILVNAANQRGAYEIRVFAPFWTAQYRPVTVLRKACTNVSTEHCEIDFTIKSITSFHGTVAAAPLYCDLAAGPGRQICNLHYSQNPRICCIIITTY
jgi:hypothetical protein